MWFARHSARSAVVVTAGGADSGSGGGCEWRLQIRDALREGKTSWKDGVDGKMVETESLRPSGRVSDAVAVAGTATVLPEPAWTARWSIRLGGSGTEGSAHPTPPKSPFLRPPESVCRPASQRVYISDRWRRCRKESRRPLLRIPTRYERLGESSACSK